MKILFICSGNSKNQKKYRLIDEKPFIEEQRRSLIKKGIDVDVFLIKDRGLWGYLRNLPALRKKIYNGNYDLVHAHYGLAGMLAVLQRKCPVVISLIGEMNLALPRIISKVAIKLSSYSIFVSEELMIKANIKKKYSIIPYGIDLKTFFPIAKIKSREKLNMPKTTNFCLFASSKEVRIKNYRLAKQALDLCGNINLMQLGQGYTRDEVNLLINGCDLVLLTSFFEGSPQIIKEAMACNTPIVSTDVGDVRKIIENTAGCYIASFEPEDVADKIKLALAFDKKTNGRNNIKHLEIDTIANKIIEIYTKTIA